ncbi:MAG: peptidoglycan-binding protein [Clostridia bacterium]|nr:peptidoglycan-binding protein [Clostridia bacterium]
MVKRWLALLLALCMVFGVLPALAEKPVVIAGPYAFELPEGTDVGRNKKDNQFTIFEAEVDGQNGDYELIGITIMYDEADRDEQGVMDYETFYLLTMSLFKDLLWPDELDTEMPDGQLLLEAITEKNGNHVVAVSHYYNGAGFLLTLMAPKDNLMIFTLRESAQEIAQAARLVTELELPEDGYRMLEPGCEGDDVLQARNAMYKLGFFANKPTQTEYTQAMTDYVEKFERAFGLEVDGLLSPRDQALLFYAAGALD